MALFICDLDGTVADDRERKLKAGPEPSRDNKPEYLAWLGFIQSDAALSADAPIPGMATLLRGLAREQAIIVYLTAREEKYRDVTRAWLRKHNFPSAMLFMRPNESWLSSRELKQTYVMELKASYPSLPVVAIDDDGSGDCEAMYRDLEIPHLHMRLAPLKASEKEKSTNPHENAHVCEHPDCAWRKGGCYPCHERCKHRTEGM